MLGGRVLHVTTAKLLISALLLVFVLVEWVPRWKSLTFPPTGTCRSAAS